MPNGGPTPDCIHCEKYRGKPFIEKEPYCTCHNMLLATPIRAFCSRYIDPEPDEKGDWLDQKLDRSTLKPDWMYIWMDWSEEANWEAKGIKSTFEYFPLITIGEYSQWVFQDVLDAIVKIADEKRGGYPP